MSYQLILYLSECPPGKFGLNCALDCKCQNGGECLPATGGCTCPKGWAGLTCDKSR